MADLLSTLLTKGNAGATKVTNSASSEAIAALQNAYNINLNAAQNTGVSGDIAAKAIAEANKNIQTGAAATRGSGAYSSAALQVAKDKAMAEAANTAAIENAKLQQQSAAQAAGAAANLANATKTTTTGVADPKSNQMLEIMKALAISERTSSGATPATGGQTASTGNSLGNTVANKALGYGGRIAQVGLTSALGKIAMGLNPVLGAGLMLAGSDVIKSGTGSLVDMLGEAFGLKKKAPETQAAAAAPDTGMVDFVNAATSAGFDMTADTSVAAPESNESANALADLLGMDANSTFIDAFTGGKNGDGGSWTEREFDANTGMSGGHFGSDETATADAGTEDTGDTGGKWW